MILSSRIENDFTIVVWKDFAHINLFALADISFISHFIGMELASVLLYWFYSEVVDVTQLSFA